MGSVGTSMELNDDEISILSEGLLVYTHFEVQFAVPARAGQNLLLKYERMIKILPVRKLMTTITLRQETVEKVLYGVSHVNRWKLARLITGGANTSQLV